MFNFVKNSSTDKLNHISAGNKQKQLTNNQTINISGAEK